MPAGMNKNEQNLNSGAAEDFDQASKKQKRSTLLLIL